MKISRILVYFLAFAMLAGSLFIAGCSQQPAKTIDQNGQSQQGIGAGANAGGTTDSGNAANPGSGNGNGAASGSSLDESKGVKCTQNGTSLTYYFKAGKVRTETSISGVGTQVSIQPDDSTSYSISTSGSQCGAIKIAPSKTFAQLRQNVIGSWQAQQGTSGASRTGAYNCVQADLADSLFELPAGCPVANP